MDSDGRPTLPIPSPTTQERAALRLVGAYFGRAREVATQCLLAELIDFDHIAGVVAEVDVAQRDRTTIGLRAGTAAIAGIGAASEANV
jgi:hypothetical protein